MVRAELIWPYVEKTLVEFLGDRAKLVDERVVAVQHGSSNLLVRLVDGDEPRLQVFSPMLHGVEKTPELLDTLNGFNAGMAFAKIFWIDGDVMVAMELLADSLDRESIDNALRVVAGSADRFDDELKARFGGETAFPQPEEPTEDTGPTPSEEAGSDGRHEGAPEGVGLPPGMEQGEEPEPRGSDTGSAPERPQGERPAAAGTDKDSDEAPGYL
jgi:hypothetical protein